MNLNPAQAEAVKTRAQDILVLACAGAGKTRVLIERIAHLIETDTPPWAILAVTFTNKAAEEMRERLADRVGKARAARVWMGTFHALAAKTLRDFGAIAGFPDGFSIYDDEDRLDVVKLCAHEMGLKLTAKEPSIDGIEGVARRANKGPFLRSLYEATLRRYAATDYDGLEVHLLALLHAPAVIEHMRQFREILVDEYQDTNDAQEAVLTALRAAVPEIRVMMVGDPSQCIPGDQVVQAPDGPRQIRDVRPGDSVMGSIGGVAQFHTVFEVRRSEKTKAIRFDLDDGTSFTATPDHTCFAALDNPTGFYVYMMFSSGHGYRLGVTQRSGTMARNIIVRTQQEGADRLWVLGWFATREDAVMVEERLSLRWQVPTVPFNSRCPDGVKGGSWSQRNIDGIFREFGANGSAVLDYYGLEFDRPNYLAKATGAKHRIAVNILMATKHGHRVEVETSRVSPDKARALGMKAGKKGTYRIRKEFRHLGDAQATAKSLVDQLGGLTVEHLSGTTLSRRMFAVPAASIHQHMAVPVLRDGRLTTAKVVHREVVDCSDCYDLEVDVTANFSVGTACAVVHNCIYGFRGSQIGNILRAAERPGMHIIRLATNYRSGRAVVEAGNRIAAHTGSPLGRVEAGRDFEGRAAFEVHPEEDDLACSVASSIQINVAGGRSPGDVMVLARTWRALERVEAELRALGVPCEFPKREADAWRSQPMRWLVAAMRLQVNPRDGIALRRVLRWPSAACSEAQLLRAEVRSKGATLAALREEGAAGARLVAVQAETAGEFATRFAATSDAWEDLAARELDTQRDELDAAVARIVAWTERRAAEEQAVDLKSLLAWYTFRDVRDAEAAGEPRVRLMTVHAAKGLEAPVVHFIGPDLGIFPRVGEDPAGEELRLWYVAVTRARDMFVAHSAEEVSQSWGSGVRRAGVSPFVAYLRDDAEALDDAGGL